MNFKPSYGYVSLLGYVPNLADVAAPKLSKIGITKLLLALIMVPKRVMFVFQFQHESSFQVLLNYLSARYLSARYLEFYMKLIH